MPIDVRVFQLNVATKPAAQVIQTDDWVQVTAVAKSSGIYIGNDPSMTASSGVPVPLDGPYTFLLEPNQRLFAIVSGSTDRVEETGTDTTGASISTTDKALYNQGFLVLLVQPLPWTQRFLSGVASYFGR